MINIIRYRYWYFLFSLVIIVPGVIFLLAGGLKAGIDFTGGTELTVRLPHVQPSTTLENEIRDAVLKNAKLSQVEVVSSTPFGGGTSSGARYLIRIPNISNNDQALAAILAPPSGSRSAIVPPPR
jgi:preprotein translocase subunit SecF